ncbi:ribosomal biogenesis protein LAS1L [Cataglyphis hispanica]|uniref:ribosomal biogenesis protein LAS1L n=1 Tax=Cataglyphis hispanica TaxID=1086592 RepID=UPI00217F64FD|nr:ribosomal biogenesis protein LAS1L [Cataglyphis hispanica]
MALFLKRDDIKQVPWFSLSEWHDVYRQIYSNDVIEQTKAYEALLAWKARIPKLPVGVDCTLTILQVCLRDREWTSKIDSGELPMYCENDLSLMYSTTIMRFLNHFCNIGHTKQTSLFQIAKQLKIPEWIVNLRHQAAHGYELPSIGVLRIAINVLLHWLHDEYWAAEACAIEKCYTKEANMLEEKEELEEIRAFTDLIELWTAVSLYIDAGYKSVSNLPEVQLREILQDLRTYMLSQYCSKILENDENEYISIHGKTIKIDKEYNLKAAQALLLSEISIHLTENKSLITIHKKSDIICNVLLKNEAFLPNSDIMQVFQQKGRKNVDLRRKILPSGMLRFWKDIIFLLHNKKILDILIFKLLSIVNQEQESKGKRTLATLWISSIVYSFIQLDLAQNISRTMEYKSTEGTKIAAKSALSQHLKELVHHDHPYLRNVLWLNISSTVPYFLVDINFLSKLLLHVNEFSARLIEPILKFVSLRINVQAKKHLLNLLKIYTFQKYNDEDNKNDIYKRKVFTVEDFDVSLTKNKVKIDKKEGTTKKKTAYLLTDQIIRNLHWKSASDTLLSYQWVESPIGLLPWQMDSLKSLKPLEINPSKHFVSILDSQIIAGVVNRKNLKMQSRIKWENILRKKRRIERKRHKNIADVIMNRALEIAKKTDTM